MAKILVVDDEQLTVDMLSTFLRLLGHEAIDALSGRQARDRLAYAEPDAILLDIMMPDINGIDLCRELRTNSATARVPIIIISAHMPPKIQEAMDAGATTYLPKPINLQTLRSSLEQAGIVDVKSR